ncbi:hypothetical protein BST13_10180 [Mycobacterium aquaticum]|uniref:Uncharacterized protein n=1 Tax=Mycobacterium aquaticum TaxID=1927124 RepID=A0A1X0B5B6_9MYCO|nr:hypothetical protein BST13_10180 [Mycobacterium aquaticum]
MVALELLCVAVAAMWLGYRLGRRTTKPAATWWRRMPRSALGQQAVALIVLVAANQVQRSMRRKLKSPRAAWFPLAPRRRATPRTLRAPLR